MQTNQSILKWYTIPTGYKIKPLKLKFQQDIIIRWMSILSLIIINLILQFIKPDTSYSKRHLKNILMLSFAILEN